MDVSKVSANPDTERGERGGDHWVFGGIYRPVYLEAEPAQWIEGVAIDARADGTFAAGVTLRAPRTVDRVAAQLLSASGQPVGTAFSTRITGGGTGRVHLSNRIEADWVTADALAVTVSGPDVQELWNWVWKVPPVKTSVLTWFGFKALPEPRPFRVVRHPPQTRIPGGHRQANGNTAVLPLAHVPAVLACDPN